MANIATLLKNEIQKQTDKAVRKSLRPLALQLREEQKRVKDLERQVAQLNKNIQKGGAAAAKAVSAPAAAPAGNKRAWNGSTVTNLRKSHQLSQNALAKLLGVGINTVWLWEQNRTSPRAKQQEGIAALCELSSLQIRRRLTKVGLTEGRSKPGRKAGSKNKPAAVAKKATGKVAKKTKAKVAKKTTKKTVRKASKKK
jgi:transcriptional regulator with XRE-family HTH domain